MSTSAIRPPSTTIFAASAALVATKNIGDFLPQDSFTGKNTSSKDNFSNISKEVSSAVTATARPVGSANQRTEQQLAKASAEARGDNPTQGNSGLRGNKNEARQVAQNDQQEGGCKCGCGCGGSCSC